MTLVFLCLFFCFPFFLHLFHVRHFSCFSYFAWYFILTFLTSNLSYACKLVWCHALMGGSGSALLSRKMSQEPCHTCPWGTSQQRCSRLYPPKNGRSGGNRARPTIWEKTPSTTSRGNSTLTSSSNTAMFLWIQPLHRPRSLGSGAGLGKVYFSCLRLSLK